MPTLPTVIQSNLLAPDDFHTFKHTKAGSGLSPITLRALLVGVISAAGTATPLTPVRAYDEADARAKAGVGSELHLMAARAFRQGELNAARGQGSQPEIWLLPIAAVAGGAVAAAQTLTVALGGTAGAGNVEFVVAGRTLFASVNAGDAADTIATAIRNAINAAGRELPVTAAAAAAVVTVTHRTTGTNGNDVKYRIVSTPANVTVTPAVSVVGTGVVDITAALDAAVDRNYQAIAISIHSAAAVSDALDHLNAMWNPAQRMWRWLFMAEHGSLATAQALAAAANDERIIVATAEDLEVLPSETATELAVLAFGTEKPNAGFDWCELASPPPPATSAYTSTEVQSALQAGCTPIEPNATGSRAMVRRLVTTRTTRDAVEYYDLLDLAFSRTLAYRAEQYHVGFRTRFKNETIDGDLTSPESTLLPRVRGMCAGIDREMGRLGYLRNVEDTVPAIQVAEAAGVQGRLVAKAPCRVAGPLHQIDFQHEAIYL